MKSRILKISSLLMLLLLMAGLPALAEAVAPKPTSVKLNVGKTIQVAVGSSVTLTPALTPENAQTTFKWSSSKKKVASVSGGVVTGKKVGTTTITVTTANKKKAKVKVKVVDPYKPASVSFTVSGTQTLLVMNKLQLNTVLFPETAKSSIKWKSSNKKVAVVNSKGEVTGIMPGKTTITATTRNKKKCKIKIKVIDDGKQPISTTPDYDLPYVIYACKKSHTIAIIARDENNAWTRVLRVWPTGTGRESGTTDVGTFFLRRKERWHKWGSGYSPYANRISVGIYLHGPIFVKKNHTSIRRTYYNCIGTNCSSGCLRTVTGCAGWIYYNCPLGTQVIVAQNSRFSAPRPAKLGKNAKKDPTDPGVNNFEILMTSFTVNPGSMTMNAGESLGITIDNITPKNTTTKSFTFTSRDPSVATVSSSGVVTGVGAGTTEVVITANDDFMCSTVVSVTVNAVESTPKLAEAEETPEDLAFESDALVAVEEAADAVIADADDAQAAGEDFFFDETESVPEDLTDLPVEEE